MYTCVQTHISVRTADVAYFAFAPLRHDLTPRCSRNSRRSGCPPLLSCCGCCNCGQSNFPTASSKLGICTFWVISNALAAKSDFEYLHILVFNAAPTPWLPSTFAFIFYPAFRFPIFLEESFNEVFNASLQHQRAAMQDGACPITLGDKLARCVSGELNAITRWPPLSYHATKCSIALQGH